MNAFEVLKDTLFKSLSVCSSRARETKEERDACGAAKHIKTEFFLQGSAQLLQVSSKDSSECQCSAGWKNTLRARWWLSGGKFPKVSQKFFYQRPPRHSFLL